MECLDDTRFPNSSLGFDIRDCARKILYPKGNTRLYHEGKWLNFPDSQTPLRYTECMISELFNDLGEAILSVEQLGRHLVRKWTPRFADTPVPHDRIAHSPDVVLMNTTLAAESKEKLGWSSIFSSIEYRDESESAGEYNLSQLSKTADLILATQPDRGFVLGVSLVNSLMTLLVSTTIFSAILDRFDIHQNPERFIRVVAGLLFADRTYLGFDPVNNRTKVDQYPSISGKVMTNSSMKWNEDHETEITRSAEFRTHKVDEKKPDGHVTEGDESRDVPIEVGCSSQVRNIKGTNEHSEGSDYGVGEAEVVPALDDRDLAILNDARSVYDVNSISSDDKFALHRLDAEPPCDTDDIPKHCTDRGVSQRGCSPSDGSVKQPDTDTPRALGKRKATFDSVEADTVSTMRCTLIDAQNTVAPVDVDRNTSAQESLSTGADMKANASGQNTSARVTRSMAKTNLTSEDSARPRRCPESSSTTPLSRKRRKASLKRS